MSQTLNLAETIKAAARDQGVTQQQLADAAGVSRQTVSAWFGGRNQINAASVEAMMDLLGLTVVRTDAPWPQPAQPYPKVEA